MNVNSAFECYINCVKNPACDFAISSQASLCYLKNYNPSHNLELNKFRNTTEYGEYIVIPSKHILYYTFLFFVTISLLFLLIFDFRI